MIGLSWKELPVQKRRWTLSKLPDDKKIVSNICCNRHWNTDKTRDLLDSTLLLGLRISLYSSILKTTLVVGRWRSWLSHLSNTQKVLSSSLGRLICSAEQYFFHSFCLSFFWTRRPIFDGSGLLYAWVIPTVCDTATIMIIRTTLTLTLKTMILC